MPSEKPQPLRFAHVNGPLEPLHGPFVGLTVGDAVGIAVGDAVGLAVGDAVGFTVGRFVGDSVIGWLGVSVGALEEEDGALVDSVTNTI